MKVFFKISFTLVASPVVEREMLDVVVVVIEVAVNVVALIVLFEDVVVVEVVVAVDFVVELVLVAVVIGVGVIIAVVLVVVVLQSSYG